MSTFTTITNNHFYEILKVDALAGETDWSINKNARVGDRVLLYVCAAVSAIVATAIISDDVYLDEDINSTWFGTYFAKMSDLKMLSKPVTRAVLLWEFPNWRYWSQPRNSIQVPTGFVSVLEKLLNL